MKFPKEDHLKWISISSMLPQVALHPFPGDLHLLTTAAPEGWEPRALFGSQRFKAGKKASVEVHGSQHGCPLETWGCLITHRIHVWYIC